MSENVQGIELNIGEVDETSVNKPIERISVRRLVEFVLRSGDLTSGSRGSIDVEAALAGARIHKKIQKSQKGPYASEVSLKTDVEYAELILRVEGRADGILEGDDPTVDEIKGMYLDVKLLEEPFPIHLAQVKCYAAIYAADQGYERIKVRMIYVDLENEDLREFRLEYSEAELRTWFREVCGLYYRWAKWQLEHIESRNQSMEPMRFPFPYREGQQKLTAAVWHTIKNKQELFLMAPTGVGKTMSCVYPAVRAVGQGFGERIFYLTAKNETLAAGREAFSILDRNGLDFRTVVITSKEKICPYDEQNCDPEKCPYAKGHFDRVNDAVFELINTERYIDRDVIRRQSEKHQVCPFELTLDTSSWCDAILCDYNYVFDPNVQLKRFFGNGVKGDYIFLVDEAHNLVERGRDMYSAKLIKENVLTAKRAVGKKSPRLTKALERVNKLMLNLKHLFEQEAEPGSVDRAWRILQTAEFDVLDRAAFLLYEELQNFYETSEDYALKDELLDFYFEIRDFVFTSEFNDENYCVYSACDEEDHFMVRMFCVNPSGRLTSCIDRGRAAILFSATLLPINYYKRLLTTRSDVPAVYAESPFDRSNRLLTVGRDVNTRYKDRTAYMFRRIAAYIFSAAKGRVGNYMAFFPSYRLMRDVFEVFRDTYQNEDINWVVQMPGMRDDDREIFLENFYEDPAHSLVGFCVMGGMFSEGIDLTGTRLIGAVVVGAGIPQVSGEREILRRFFDSDGEGFDYAYRYPGMNKVEQAAGRVIRTADDKGVILLLDSRFWGSDYRKMFPREWCDADSCTLDDVDVKISEFWDRVIVDER